MNGVHNYHKNIKMYVLRCTTMRLKPECGHKTSRRADMNLMFIYVVLPIDMYIYIYNEGYTNIDGVIGIILLAISPLYRNSPGGR